MQVPEEKEAGAGEVVAKPEAKPKSKKVSKGCAIGCAFTLLVAVCIVTAAVLSGGSDTTPATPATPASSPALTPAPTRVKHLTITVDSVKHEWGFLTIAGTVVNDGDEAIYNPTLHLTVFDRANGALVADEVEHPVGQFLEDMPVHLRCAFKFMVLLSEEGQTIEWQIITDNCSSNRVTSE